MALRSCDERDLYWCRALRGSKVPGAECNNQSSPALIRYLRASGSAIEYPHHLSHAFKHGECRQSYENLKRPPVIKDTRASRCVCGAARHADSHTFSTCNKIHNTDSPERSAVIKAGRPNRSDQGFLPLSLRLHVRVSGSCRETFRTVTGECQINIDYFREERIWCLIVIQQVD